MHKGYVKVWRKIEDSGFMQIPNTLALFMHILFNATHKERKLGTPAGVIELKRGQYVSGRIELARVLKQSEQQIRTSLKKLELMEIITIQSTNRFSIYTIENYGKYQDEQPADNQQVNQQSTSKQPADNQQITTKQELNNSNIKEFNKKSKAIADKSALPFPDFIDSELWNDFLEVRKELKAKNTLPAIKALINKLIELRDNGDDPVQVVMNSIRSSWKDVYPIKDKPKNGNIYHKKQEEREQYNKDTNAKLKARLFGAEKEVHDAS
jgi:hypothetical protein